MSALCVLLDGVRTLHAVSVFTLAWTHSVEHVRWEESWRVGEAGLVIEEARVRGSGAGMEPGEDAVFDGHWWRWRPSLPAQTEILLARSGATGGQWQLCTANGCTTLPETPGGAAAPAALFVCKDG